IESALWRRHQNALAVLANECRDDLGPRGPALVQIQHLTVQRGAVLAVEVGRAAGVNVESAAAGAAQLLFDRLDDGEVVPRGERLQRPAGALRIGKATGGTGAGERVGKLDEWADGRIDGWADGRIGG